MKQAERSEGGTGMCRTVHATPFTWTGESRLGWVKTEMFGWKVHAAHKVLGQLQHVATILSSLEMAVATSVFLVFPLQMLVMCVFPWLLCEKASVCKGFCV